MEKTILHNRLSFFLSFFLSLSLWLQVANLVALNNAVCVSIHVLPLYFTSNLHNHTFPITQNTCCNTRNCIYTIHCTLCTHIPTIYVGETKNCIRSRFSQHKHNITTHNNDTVVSKHFNQTNHNLSMLRISVLQFFTDNPKNSRKTDFMRKKYELLWINKLHTYTPIGLNIVTHLKPTNIPLILEYSNSASQLLRQVKNTLSNDTTYPYKFSITSSFTNHKNLQKSLAPTKF